MQKDDKKRKIIQVPYINQAEQWPTGCESVSAVMLLQYLSVDITVDEFIRKYLPCRPFEELHGRLVGASPWEEFAGSPYDVNSMGCYAPVIQQAITKVLTEKKRDGSWRVEDLSGIPMERLCAEYIDKDRPVIFWACIDMLPPFMGPRWYLQDGQTEFTWISNEHCMLLVGYDEEKYYYNDPWNNNGLIGYEKALAETRHKALYNMAITAYRTH